MTVLLMFINILNNIYIKYNLRQNYTVLQGQDARTGWWPPSDKLKASTCFKQAAAQNVREHFKAPF